MPLSDSFVSVPVLRSARPQDVPQIAALLAAYAGRGLVRSRPTEELHRNLDSFVVAESSDRIAGCVALRVHSPRLAEIASLAVDEGYHGQGIGHRLIQAAVLRAHARGVQRVFGFTYRERLFHRLGFRSAPTTEFPQKLAADYGGYAIAAGPKVAVVLDLEAPLDSMLPRRSWPRSKAAGSDTFNETFPRELQNPSNMAESESKTCPSIAILGGGNLGRALAMGWTEAGYCAPEQIWITRRNPEKLTYFADAGFRVGADNVAAVQSAEIIVLAVQPQQVEELMDELQGVLNPARHRVISVISGVSIRQLREWLGSGTRIVRAMPNTAVSIGQSMTCLATEDATDPAIAEAQELFDLVGRTLVIPEDMMIPATALCACGIAFFLRSIRAASQGGIEIGFHPEEALLLAAQTAKGAAGLLLSAGRHPESEIDQVTTPRGCTIAGLNEMEHQGFSSAMIKGILLSAAKAEGLYRSD